MIKIGLTGNVGSGKSTVSKVFESIGYTLIDVDVRAKELYSDPAIREQVENLLQTKIQRADGRIDYSVIAERYFTDPAIYKALNEILYPVLQKKIEAEVLASQNDVVVEAAMLFEIGLQQYFDYVITVSTPIEERIQRLLKRSMSSREEIMLREKLQTTAEWKEAQAHFVICNDERSSVIEQVINILEQIQLNP